ncbi:MAG TPA: autotransporter outer membrane beta-barrel domain-containing protein [Xanthobacteraceae bacterium]|nr:autotransporter outer membrane beta-barrel domain-containing protein [Xanthobacteraceae bacterium]HWW49291.1 autotransporter outer membrane beta-barrel domain-containing protein [Xanthobacteraceae bacterium]
MADTAFFKSARTTQTLLASVSLSALVIPVLSCASVHAAEESVQSRVLAGKNGKNGTIHVFGYNEPGEAGGNGPAIVLTNTYSTSSAKTTAVTVGSRGGNGGAGLEILAFTTHGGRGGNGGEVKLNQIGALTGTASPSVGTALLWVYSQGGRGGGASYGAGRGGDGGAVELSLASTISATGEKFAAVWAQSLGGAAGYGGIDKSEIERNRGGDGGNVKVTVGRTATVTASGKNAPAIIAESIGGKGVQRGNGYLTANYVSNGGNAGNVEFTNYGSVKATGSHSAGVLLQSVGGGGGDQGLSNGDPGGAGGSGGKVTGTNWGTISTDGAYNFGLLAQSLGGSGGKGGTSDFGSGGKGGAAGAGGEVSVTNHGKVDTNGAGAIGIVAQSVGGGNATSAFAMTGVPQPGGGGAGGRAGIFFGSGGDGGTGGNGGKVTVANNGSIKTKGQDAYGILAQSIGGGGGAGGGAVTFGPLLGFALGGRGNGGGNGGDVTVKAAAPIGLNPNLRPAGTPEIFTEGKGATGIVGLSVGGAGGIGGTATAISATPVLAIAVAVGGDGGKGGNGGKVEVENNSKITTYGMQARGIDAKSIGGGGGNAGNAFAYALSLPAADLPSIAVTYAMGGTGGDGGNGGAVKVVNSSAIATFGSEARGIEAVSIGGGGGSGGTSTSMSDMLSLYLNVGVSLSYGGSGGGGGHGGAVAVTNEKSIETAGGFSAGIYAQSIGGGGGNGGTANAVANAGFSWNEALNTVTTTGVPLAESFTAKYVVGGKGANAGHGGAVTATNSGTITTGGSNAPAIFAQSVGGGGGEAGGYLASGKGTFNVSGEIGGKGGGGGNGGSVQVLNTKGARIETNGAGSIGILAQSVGGGGGVGGMTAGSQKSAGEMNTAQTVVTFVDELIKIDKVFSEFLGTKEKNALAEYKLLDKNHDLQKKLEKAAGVLKVLKIALDGDKSLGRRIGEAGGMLAGGVALGALKKGIESIYQEIASKDPKYLPSVSLGQTVGGTGGKGGKGGDIEVVNAGDIVTAGIGSWGIFAQSIGGGGGLGGTAAATGNNKMNINYVGGGTGGDGGNGGTVKAANSGGIATQGGGALGILAQSVGGGGGTGGAATSANTIGLNATARLGGNAGVSSNGGLVEVNNSGTISTAGREAHAIVAQSVGGGGGLFFVSRYDPSDPAALASSKEEKEALALTYDLLKDFGLNVGGMAADLSSTMLPLPSVNFSYGGDGGKGGDGGNVRLTHSGAISTTGIGAFGIFAQSVGGGGGLGVDMTSANNNIQFQGSLGGDGGVAGNGGRVELAFHGKASISTSGAGADAVFLQSVGGGGGYSGVGHYTVAGAQYDLIKDGAASGNGGLIAVSTAGPDGKVAITTTGKNANGIFAQSLGGGGGRVFDASGQGVPVAGSGISRTRAVGKGGEIKIDTAGSIVATGEGASAIFAQSGVQKTDGTLDRTKQGGNITIVHEGILTGGSDPGRGAAIRIDGGWSNSITIKPGSVVSAASGTAILSNFGREYVSNFGLIQGSVRLADPGANEYNVFANEHRGTYQTIANAIVELGSNGILMNNGLVDVGGASGLSHLRVNGNFDQASSGDLKINVASGAAGATPQSSLLDVNGNLFMKGAIKLYTVDYLRPDVFKVATASGQSEYNVTVGSFGAGSPFSWTGWAENGTFYVTPQATFTAPAGVNISSSEKSTTDYLQRIWASGTFSANSAKMFADFGRLQTPADFARAIDSLSPEESASATTSQTLDARLSLNAALSCPLFEGASTLLQETSCAWARVIGSKTTQRETAEAAAYDHTQMTYRGGLQKEFAEGWFVGGTIGFSQSWLRDPDGLSTSRGNSVDGAVSLKRQLGPWLFAVSGQLGFGNYMTDRTFDIAQSLSYASGTSNIWTAAARLRASREFAFPTWYLKPYVDVDFIYTATPAHEERGSGTSLAFSAARQFNVAFSPNLEFGGRFDVSPTTWLRPYGAVGATFFTNDSTPFHVSFSDVALGTGDFLATAKIPSKLLNLTAGLQTYSKKGFEVRAQYKADFGDHFQSHELSARLSVPF